MANTKHQFLAVTQRECKSAVDTIEIVSEAMSNLHDRNPGGFDFLPSKLEPKYDRKNTVAVVNWEAAAFSNPQQRSPFCELQANRGRVGRPIIRLPVQG